MAQLLYSYNLSGSTGTQTIGSSLGNYIPLSIKPNGDIDIGVQLTYVGTATSSGAVYTNGGPYFYFSVNPLTLGSQVALVSTTGTSVPAILACFLRGTLIMTDAGEVAVEHLAVGDRVMTAKRKACAISWIGHRRVDAPDVEAHPIRIRAGSFGAGLPVRDLFVSPEHCIFVDGALVPAMQLVNGDSIARVAMDDITYYHVMLDHHDVILAERLPVESFLPDDNFDQFDNWAGAPVHDLLMQPCAPRVTQGARLQNILTRLQAVQGHPELVDAV